MTEAQATPIGRVVYAWGQGSSGQQGNNGTADILVPTEVPQLTTLHAERGIHRHYAGLEHNIAIMADGSVFTWGLGSCGQLGNGGTTNVAVPTLNNQLTTLSQTRGISQVHVGLHHQLIVTDDNAVFAWGRNENGQIGNNSTANVSTPTEIPALTNLVRNRGAQLQINYRHGFAVASNGAVYGWGDGTFLGRNNTANVSTPTEIPALTNLVRNRGAEIVARERHAFAFASDGTVYGWGWGINGRLGNNSEATLLVPTPISQLTTFIAAHNIEEFHFGVAQTFAITTAGTVYVWGAGTLGQLGNGVAANASVPTVSQPLTNFYQANDIELFHVPRHVNNFMAITDDGRVYVWGWGSFGRLGHGTEDNLYVPTEVPDITDLAQAGAQFFMGGRFTFAFAPVELAEANFNLTKHLQKPEGTPAPNLNFRFTFERNSFNDNTTPADIARIPVINPVIINPTTVVSPPPPPAGTVTLSGYFDFLESIVFTEVGTYSWIIREDATHPAGQGLDSTVVFSQAEYELRVYVGQEPGIGGNLYIRFITLHRIQNADGSTPENGREKVNNLIFVNQYTYDPLITPTGLWMTGSSLYLVIFATGVTLTAYLSLKARKRIEELPIMH